MSIYRITKNDVTQASDQFCSKCKTKKSKYLGTLLTQPAVLYKDNCKCNKPINSKKLGKSNKEIFDYYQTPFWKLMGQKAKPQDVKLEKYLKNKNMTYGDLARQRDYARAKNPSGVNQFYDHVNKYGKNNAPDTAFRKS